MPAFEDEYLDVLQNIEAAIVDAYRNDGELTDYDVDKVLNAVYLEYRAEAQGKTPSSVNLNERTQQVYKRVKTMCEWRLGRTALEIEDGSGRVAPLPKSLEEIMACLKRIRKSVEFWSKEGGRRGYLEFINENIGM
ncbi:MAG: hypothetical protein HND47_13695 [Chloroflexi bacterium]|nr:hypothetical protein [Chloroflexota bacterium]